MNLIKKIRFELVYLVQASNKILSFYGRDILAHRFTPRVAIPFKTKDIASKDCEQRGGGSLIEDGGWLYIETT